MAASVLLMDEVVDHVAATEQNRDTNQHGNKERHVRLLSLIVPPNQRGTSERCSGKKKLRWAGTISRRGPRKLTLHSSTFLECR